jgi:hypothetical protein
MKALNATILLAAALAVTASAENVNSLNPNWVVISSGPNTGTFGLPANLSSIGCGTENNNTCEPTGVFQVQNPFLTGLGYYTMDDGDSAATPSDVIVFSNQGGIGTVTFYSDPNLPASNSGFGTLLGHCSEDATLGCIMTVAASTAATNFTIDLASDGEAVFDPFGLGADSSDEIRFTGTGVTVSNSPEPSSLMLIGSGLLGLGFLRRRKASK